jgi:threonine dehydrogenase-like Zn-dependent dehydrogenase
MRAVVLDYDRRELAEREVADPPLPGPGGVLFRVDEVGVCGTDRELASFQTGYPPEGERFLILGHEAAGTVIGTGPGVTRLRKGDRVAPMVRRPCRDQCRSCRRQRPDLCLTGRCTERGIFGAHGFFSELALEREEYLVAVPAELKAYAVLMEPLSVVEKAIATALRYREEPPETALVMGAGPIGILSALALKARGLDVTVRSLEPETHPRARLAAMAGARYTRERVRGADLAVEATGAPDAALEAVRSLGALGVCAILGASRARGRISFRDLVVGNQVVFGSVNASAESFGSAREDLGKFDRRVLDGLVTREPASAFARTILAPPGEAAKFVHVLY